MLQSPQLIFRVRNKAGKVYTLLMSSDYERNSWKETIAALKQKGNIIINLMVVFLSHNCIYILFFFNSTNYRWFFHSRATESYK